MTDRALDADLRRREVNRLRELTEELIAAGVFRRSDICGEWSAKMYPQDPQTSPQSAIKAGKPPGDLLYFNLEGGYRRVLATDMVAVSTESVSYMDGNRRRTVSQLSETAEWVESAPPFTDLPKPAPEGKTLIMTWADPPGWVRISPDRVVGVHADGRVVYTDDSGREWTAEAGRGPVSELTWESA